MILSLAAVLWIFHIRETPERSGFPVTDRYFINFTPLGIVATVFFLKTLLKALRERTWAQVLICAGAGYLLIHRMIKVIPEIRGFYPNLFQ